MKYYPIFLDINGKNCLVVGGGPVGARKAVTLKKCGANVKVISDRFSSECRESNLISNCLEKREYEKKELEGMFFVFAATHHADLNQQIKKDAAALNILCNVADAPDSSDFLLPSIIDRGDLVVAVSTSGKSPAMAKQIRQDIEKQLGHELTQFLKLMGSIREKRLSSGHSSDENKRVFYTLLEKGVVELILKNDDIKINKILKDVLGKEYTYEDLVSSRGDE